MQYETLMVVSKHNADRIFCKGKAELTRSKLLLQASVIGANLSEKNI